MSASAVSNGSSLAQGYGNNLTPVGPRSPSSSVCSFSGSVNSEILTPNKYLMKTLCLSKKSTALPGKAEYANLLTSGLGARKWVANLEFDAESFKAAIINIYPRLATVPSYTLWNVKQDKTFEKLPSTVNTPKRIKAYLGASFTGSLVIMPSEEISLGPVKVPLTNHFNNSNLSSASSSRSSRTTSSKYEKESGYESYQDSISSRDQSYYHGSSLTSSHSKLSLSASTGRHRQICLACGRLAKQIGSTSFYDIHNTTTFATSDGYVSIAKKLRDLFHLELPRSKIIASEQICRKCFRALNEIHFLETQLRRSKEEMMSTLFSTVAKISKLEQMARDASASSSSDSSTSSLGTLMKAAALNPWFQEARYILEQQRVAAAAAVAATPSEQNPETSPENRDQPSPTKGAATVAIFPQGAGQDVRYTMDYNSPQPVFLAPLAGFNSAPHGARPQSPENQGAPTMVPINLIRPSANSNTVNSGYQAICNSANAIFLGKSSHYFAQSSIRDPKHHEAIEDRMAAEEEADAKEVAERDHAAYMEEAYHCRRHMTDSNREKDGTNSGGGNSSSSSSRESSLNNSSPDSQSPSPPNTTSSNGGSDSTNNSNGESYHTSNENQMATMRRPWKKRFHEALHQDQDSVEKKRTRKSEKREKIGEKIGAKEEDLTSDSSVSPTLNEKSDKN